MKKIKIHTTKAKLSIFNLWMTVMYLSRTVVYADDNTVLHSNKKQVESGFRNLMDEYKIILSGLIAFGMLTGILAFIILLMQLSSKGDNPQARSEIIGKMFKVGITTALLGAFAAVVAIYYGIMLG